MISSMICGKAYESMMWPRSSTVSEKVMPRVVYLGIRLTDLLEGRHRPWWETFVAAPLAMDAVILDVGGVLLVPHAETVSAALGVPLDAETAERAHYVG